MPRRTNAQIWEDLRREGKLKDLIAESRRDWDNILHRDSAQACKPDVAVKAEEGGPYTGNTTTSQLEYAARSDPAKASGPAKLSGSEKLDVVIKAEDVSGDKTTKFTTQHDIAGQEGAVGQESIAR